MSTFGTDYLLPCMADLFCNLYAEHQSCNLASSGFMTPTKKNQKQSKTPRRHGKARTDDKTPDMVSHIMDNFLTPAPAPLLMVFGSFLDMSLYLCVLFIHIVTWSLCSVCTQNIERIRAPKWKKAKNDGNRQREMMTDFEEETLAAREVLFCLRLI